MKWEVDRSIMMGDGPHNHVPGGRRDISLETVYRWLTDITVSFNPVASSSILMWIHKPFADLNIQVNSLQLNITR